MDHLPLNGLPRTFIDAFDAARRLGIDYIWIDALCIIQKEEDNSDWINEAGHMSAVYGGSFANLAACMATSVHEGFVHNPGPKHRNGGFVARVTTKDYCRAQNFRDEWDYGSYTTGAHLATRAWTLQERLLSPRTIYFGGPDLFWTCRTHCASESLPDGFSVLPERYSILEEDMPWNWTETVQQYSDAKLTYGSDRLPALSGIAARQQQVTGDQYLAGIWKESLITQLSWEIFGKKSRRPAWRAPTWSWASVDGDVRYVEWENWTACITVEDAWTRPSGPDPYGAVAAGVVTVSCTHLFPAHIISPGFGYTRPQSQVLWKCWSRA